MNQPKNIENIKIFCKNIIQTNTSSDLSKKNSTPLKENNEQNFDNLISCEYINLSDENFSFNNDMNEIFENHNILKDKYGFFEIDKSNNLFNNKNQMHENGNFEILGIKNNNNVDEIFLTKKRTKENNSGKKYIRKKEHSKFEKDNIMRKLNSHYISFIVKYVNFNIKTLISKKHPLFANLSYNFKKNINNTCFNELKNMTLGEVLKNEASSKNKRNMPFSKDNNKKIFDSVYESLKDLLDINYIDFFRNVYNKPLGNSDEMNKINKMYKAPKNILYFDDFVKKEMEKDKFNGKLYKERITNISKKEFVHEGYPYFKVKTKKIIK